MATWDYIVFTPFITTECPSSIGTSIWNTRNETEIPTKHVQNVTLHSSCDLRDLHYLECYTCKLMLVMHKESFSINLANHRDKSILLLFSTILPSDNYCFLIYCTQYFYFVQSFTIIIASYLTMASYTYIRTSTAYT